MLIKYVRKGGNRKKGVLVAVQVDGKINFGWSLCHRRDKFNKDKGKQIAIGRAVCGKKVKIPESLKYDMDAFVARATRYYKDKEIVSNYYVADVPIDEKSVSYAYAL